MPARNANTLRTMDAEEYRETIAELGLDQIQAGNVLGVSHRMSRYYIAGHTPIPDEAATILRFMRKFKVPASDLIAIQEETKGLDPCFVLHLPVSQHSSSTASHMGKQAHTVAQQDS